MNRPLTLRRSFLVELLFQATWHGEAALSMAPVHRRLRHSTDSVQGDRPAAKSMSNAPSEAAPGNLGGASTEGL